MVYAVATVIKLSFFQQVTNYGSWALAFVLQAAIAILIVRRKQLRRFPVFFSYTIFHLLQAVLTFVAFKISYAFYFYEWWSGEILDALITLAVIQEIFLVTFEPYDALRRWGSWLYVGGTITLCLLALLMSGQHPQGESSVRVAVLFTLQRSAAFIEIGLMFFLLLFCRLFGMTWRHYVFGIATGLVVMAAIYTAATTVRTHMGGAAEPWTGLVESAGFALGIVIWTYYFASAKSRLALDRVPGTEKLIMWNRALDQVGRRY